ncbi:MAG: beta-ketoacyl-ACP synthase II [Faecalibacterium sp.]
MERRRVVITGLGTLNPTGNNVSTSWENIKKGVCGVAPITAYDTTGLKVTLAGEVKDFDPAAYMDKREAKKMARFSQFALAAAVQAVEDSGLHCAEEDPTQMGVILSSGIGGLPVIEAEHSRGLAKGFDKVSPFFIPMAIGNMAAAHVAIRYGLQGLCTCPVTACAGGTNAIGDAFHRIRDGYESVMVAGGAESCISPLAMGGFTSMHALCTAEDPTRASIPFDAARAGFVMGEGSGVMVLENLAHAEARGAKIYAEVVGYGANCDAHHITAPAPNGEGGARAMQMAIQDARVSVAVVDYINAHGTSTPMNDACETAAIKTVFGEGAKDVSISSTKSMTGHLLGAAGGVEAIFTALALHDDFVPATIHYQTPDPACDLDYTPNRGKARALRYALSNSLGFGGHNACILLKKWDGASSASFAPAEQEAPCVSKQKKV